MEATKQTKMTKEDLHLSWKDKLNIIRDNRYFLMLFPIVMLAVMILIFGVATAGRFFKLSVMKGILSQAIIIGTCATGVAFIYSNGNLDISIGAVLGLAATLGVKAYNVTQSVVVMILATVAVALGLMAFNCTMSVVCNIKTITVAIVVTQIYGAISTLLIGGSGKIDLAMSVAAMLEDGGFRYVAFFGYFMRNLVTSFCFALGLNCNLPVGRMDTSTGSQMYLACIIGGNIALSLNLGGIGVLVFSMLFGMLAGGFVGFLFINMRILPMVLGLGISLVYECISFSMYNQQGLNLFGKPGVSILSNWGFIIVVTLLVMLVMTYLFQYSGFGYNRRAIQGNQKLAHDAGINIYKNAFLCYVAAGALVAIAGVFDTAYKSSLVPVLGMNSNSTVFANMFPMAVGVWLSKKSNPVVGILAGSLSVQFLILGLAKFTAIGVSDYMQTCIKYSVWLIFMIYRMNEDKFDHIKAKHARIALARKTRAQRAVAA